VNPYKEAACVNQVAFLFRILAKNFSKNFEIVFSAKKVEGTKINRSLILKRLFCYKIDGTHHAKALI